MTKYKKGKQILTIDYCGDIESPREWSNLGYFITVDRNYSSPDKNERLENIVKNSGEIAENLEHHIKLIRTNYRDVYDKVIAIYPIVKYEHSGVSYSLGAKHGFDYSNNGFYIITEKTQKEVETEKKDFEKVIKQEIDLYNKWCNGEVLSYELEESTPDKICKCCAHNSGGQLETIDSCAGFYSIDDVFDNLGSKAEDWQEINN